NIIYLLGEERHSRAVARAIVAARREAPIRTTGELAAIVSRVVRSKPGDIHPATRTFQALRIFVNDELDELAAALAAARGAPPPAASSPPRQARCATPSSPGPARAPGGPGHMPGPPQRPPSFKLVPRKPVVADEAETAENPRARSAKLRAAERTDAPVAVS